jgi:hypothetical protein
MESLSRRLATKRALRASAYFVPAATQTVIAAATATARAGQP